MDEKLLNTEQAAAYCGVSRSYLANSRVDGRGPSYLKIGAKVLYRKDDLNDWIKSHLVLCQGGRSSTDGAGSNRFPTTSTSRMATLAAIALRRAGLPSAQKFRH